MRTRLLVISPHLDDAVLGCADLLAECPGSVVLTVFAGGPADGDVLTEWDAACGFGSAAEAIAQRRIEDALALEVLAAAPHWLGLPDDQYRSTGQAPAIAAEVEHGISMALDRYQPDRVAMPLGLFHRDHAIVHAAALAMLRRDTAREWHAFEDTFYRRIPGLLQHRLAGLAASRVTATPVRPDSAVTPQRKRAAVRCYSSQLRGLASPGRPGSADSEAPEGYWRLDAQ